MSTCVLNQSKGQWLLSDVLNFAISNFFGVVGTLFKLSRKYVGKSIGCNILVVK
jgi:hypothetical protein